MEKAFRLTSKNNRNKGLSGVIEEYVGKAAEFLETNYPNEYDTSEPNYEITANNWVQAEMNIEDFNKIVN